MRTSSYFPTISQMLNAFEPSTKFPITDIKVNKSTGEIVVDLFLAGYSKEDISIEFEKSTLTIKGEKQNKESEFEYYIKNSADRKFTRVISITRELENIEAKFKDGVLSVHLYPKTNPALEKRKVEIK
jgi:molecular chaperone IbpA